MSLQRSDWLPIYAGDSVRDIIREQSDHQKECNNIYRVANVTHEDGEEGLTEAMKVRFACRFEGL